MIGYVRKFDGNAIMSFTISNKQLLKKCNQIWKKAGKLLKIEFDSKPIYGDDDKYIKTKTKIYDGGMIANLQSEKKPKEKSTMQVFINNNPRFCYQSKQEVLSSNTFERM